jgi:hypothetical protein
MQTDSYKNPDGMKTNLIILSPDSHASGLLLQTFTFPSQYYTAKATANRCRARVEYTARIMAAPNARWGATSAGRAKTKVSGR